jgi:hypothetical protein
VKTLDPAREFEFAAAFIVLNTWPPYARLARGQVLGLKNREFVVAARTLGMSELRVLLRHVLPNSVALAVVLMTMDFGNAIIITAALSFLGLGAVPPTPEWGAMVAEGRELSTQWWISTFPGIAIFLVALACNFLGDGLRDAIDPRLRMSSGRSAIALPTLWGDRWPTRCAGNSPVPSAAHLPPSALGRGTHTRCACHPGVEPINGSRRDSAGSCAILHIHEKRS